jgi:hypothetical protein
MEPLVHSQPSGNESFPDFILLQPFHAKKKNMAPTEVRLLVNSNQAGVYEHMVYDAIRLEACVDYHNCITRILHLQSTVTEKIKVCLFFWCKSLCYTRLNLLTSERMLFIMHLNTDAPSLMN